MKVLGQLPVFNYSCLHYTGRFAYRLQILPLARPFIEEEPTGLSMMIRMQL